VLVQLRPTRVELLPNVPAVAELVSEYEAEGWQGIAAPANTPAEIIDKLNKLVNSTLAAFAQFYEFFTSLPHAAFAQSCRKKRQRAPRAGACFRTRRKRPQTQQLLT
jgi:tripartite-type tricarboxylate transporter receptor subunit TctC